MAKGPVPRKLAKKLAQNPGQFRIESNGNGEGAQLIKRRFGIRRRSHNSRAGRREPPLMVLLAYARLAGISTDALIDDRQSLSDG